MKKRLTGILAAIFAMYTFDTVSIAKAESFVQGTKNKYSLELKTSKDWESILKKSSEIRKITTPYLIGLRAVLNCEEKGKVNYNESFTRLIVTDKTGTVYYFKDINKNTFIDHIFILEYQNFVILKIENNENPTIYHITGFSKSIREMILQYQNAQIAKKIREKSNNMKDWDPDTEVKKYIEELDPLKEK